MTVGETETVSATVSPSDSADKSLTWTTSNAKVATVSSGKITAVSAGSTTITVSTVNGKKASVNVTVKAKSIEPAYVTTSISSVKLTVKGSYPIFAEVSPENAADTSVVWSTSDNKVAYVSNGKIVAKSVGSAVITATASNGLTSSVSVTVIPKPTVYEYGYYYSTLSKDVDREIYQAIYNCLKNCEPEINEGSFFGRSDIDFSYIFRIYEFVSLDNSELFHTNKVSGLLRDGLLSEIKFEYLIEPSEYQQMVSQIDAKIASVIEEANNIDDEYERALLIYNYIKENVSYVNYDNNSYNIYGALINGKSVCEGYSEALTYMFKKAGIPALTVTGKVQVNHSWNMAEINGSWYYLDLTFDDSTKTQNPDGLYLNYFFNDLAAISVDHKVINYLDILPNATETQDNFFFRNRLIADSCDETELARVAQTSYNLFGHVVLQLKSADDFNTILNNQNLYKIAKSVKSKVSTFSYVYNEATNSIELFF